MSKVSLTKISEILGMSKSTVSKALNNYADVSPGTRKKVQDLANELNYKPNIFAQNLRSQESKIIGLLMPEIVHYFFSTIISGVAETAEKYGYSVIVAQTKDDYKNEIKQLEEVIGYSNESLSVRDGELESTLGNLIADILIEVCNPVFNNLTKQNIDFSLFNYGGIRGTMNKGNITQHNMFTIMPFKNLATVVKLDGNKVLELLNYLNKENIAHPI